MKNGYDHHQDIYTYNLSVPKKFILDVLNQSPPYPNLGQTCTIIQRSKAEKTLKYVKYEATNNFLSVFLL